MATYTSVLFNIPNIIGYIRILLIVIGCLFVNEYVFLIFILMSAGLDMIDGILARKYNQETVFGAWLDIVIDLFTRGMLWCWSLPKVGFLIMGFEFLTFVCIHSPHNHTGRGWQDAKKHELNWLAQKTISKGFKTVPGVIAMLGLWVLPIWVYITMQDLESSFLVDNLQFTPERASSFEFFITAFLTTSRIHCFFVEMCLMKNHVIMMIENNT